MTQSSFPDLRRTLGELDAGGVESMAAHALKDVALSVRDIDDTRVKGKLMIELTLERAKGGNQLLVSHKVAFAKPTTNGKATEEANGETLMYCASNGQLSVIPEHQARFDFTDSEATQ